MASLWVRWTQRPRYIPSNDAKTFGRLARANGSRSDVDGRWLVGVEEIGNSGIEVVHVFPLWSGHVTLATSVYILYA